MKKLGIVLSLMVTLTSCLEIMDEAAKAVSKSTEQGSESTSVSNFQTISVDSLYSLDVPKYMKEMGSLHPEASLQYANIYKETYTVVLHENKEDFIEIFKELEAYDSRLSTIENYVIVQKKMFNESLEGLKIQDYGLININSYPARQVKMLGVVDGIKAQYIVAFIEGTENIFMLMNWTVKDRMQRYENTFEYINNTFQLI